MADRTRAVESALDAVAAAGRVCREVQANMQAIQRIVKDDNSPVTIADFASQAVVAHLLAARLGKFVLVGEETSAYLRNPEHAAALAATIEAARSVWPDVTEKALLDAVDTGAGDPHHAGFWTLDPIDGTKGFLRGEQYAVALAFIERGEPVIGVLGCPNLARDFSAPLNRPDRHGCIYSCIRGAGLFESPADGSGKPVQLQQRPHRVPGGAEPIRVCASVEKAHSSTSDTARVLASLDRPHELVQVDSQCKYALVARGQADAYLRLPTRKDYVERIWDHAAGALIAAESGCDVTDIHGKALDFSRGRGLEANKGIVCAGPEVHGMLIGAIKRLGIGA